MAWCHRQQAITWTNVDPDLCSRMTSPGRNQLNPHGPNHNKSLNLSTILWILCIEKHAINDSLRPRPNRRHFADDILKCIFLNEDVWIPSNISLKFVPKGLINNNPALVQVMAWRRPGDKPLSELMLVRLPTHIYGNHVYSQPAIHGWSVFELRMDICYKEIENMNTDQSH